MMIARTARRRSRRGLSLVEVSVSTGLVVLLSMLVSNAWIGLGRPLLRTAERCRIAQEADLALASLARDLGGALPEGSSGGKAAGQFVGWLHPAGAALLLCFDSPTSPNGSPDWGLPDTVVSYEVIGTSLVRTNQATGVEFVAAENVESLIVQDAGTDFQITLTFEYRGTQQSYNLIAKKP